MCLTQQWLQRFFIFLQKPIYNLYFLLCCEFHSEWSFELDVCVRVCVKRLSAVRFAKIYICISDGRVLINSKFIEFVSGHSLAERISREKSETHIQRERVSKNRHLKWAQIFIFYSRTPEVRPK